MASKPKQPVYQVADNIPNSPTSGHLYMTKPHPRENYHANAVKKPYDTGVIVQVPDGVTVEVSGVYKNEVDGWQVVPQRLTGPLPPTRVYVVLWNRAMATIKIDPQAPIAEIRAFQTPTPLMWLEHEPEPEEKDLVGEREIAQQA